MSDTLWPHGLYVAGQAPLSMGFSRQEYWGGLPFPSPGDLLYPGIEPGSPALWADLFQTINCFSSKLSLWMKVREESEKAGLKLNIQKTKIMALGAISSWQIDGEKMETVTDFIFLGSKITVDDACNSEVKRCLLLWRKAVTNLDSIFKSRDTTLLTDICIVKAVVFPVVMYDCGCWAIKKAECWTIDVFKQWCWKRPSRILWIAQRSNQLILKKINSEYSLEGLMLKL